MPHPNVLVKDRCALIVIDVQEAFGKMIPDFADFATRVATVLRGIQILEVPVFVTEQYPKGLGHTAEEIRQVLHDDYEAVEKTAFSSCGTQNFADRLAELNADQVILCGLETHICVSQTAHDLLYRGFQVHVLSDCVTSRFEYNRLIGLAKMTRSGVIESSTEMALFELMSDSKHEKFKEIQTLIK
jgi:nicotinamidase-related amidase